MTGRTANSGYIEEPEKEVLGTLLFGGDFRKVAGFLREEHFIADLHQILFATIRTAFERFGSTTVPVVARLLPDDRSASFQARTGKTAAGYMASLSDSNVLGNAGLERAAKAVISQWARLKAGEVAGTLQAASLDPSADAARLIQAAVSDFDMIAAEMRAGPRRKTRVALSSAMESAIASAHEAGQRGSGLTGMTWGLTDVNRLTGGIQRRDLTLIGARPSMGKTTLGLSTALKVGKTGAGVGFMSLEMDADKLAARAISDLAYDWSVKVPYADLIRGHVDAEVIDSLRSITRDMERLPVIIEEQSGLSMIDIQIKAEAMMEEFEKRGKTLDLLCLDHLGLIRPSARYSGNRVQEIAEITAGCKSLAREFNIAVVLLSQLSRAVESRDNKRPQLSDLRDSGSIEQDADTIVFLFREAYYLERERGRADDETERVNRLLECQFKLEFNIAKQRNGPLATIDLFADMACSAIRNGEQR